MSELAETKTCQSCKVEFTIAPEDFVFYEKIQVPPPTWCPDCRAMRRMAWRNEWRVFRRPEAKTGRAVLSSFSPEAPVVIYEPDEWYSDSWDGLQYGKAYDFSKPFFAQMRELLSVVPILSRSVSNVENSEFSLNANRLKNCYLVRDASKTEDSGYVILDNGSRTIFDCTMTADCELCYDSFNLSNCYKAVGSVGCEDCRDVLFSRDCIGSSSLIGCANLRNKQYYIFNKPYSKEDYEQKLNELRIESYQAYLQLEQQAHDFWRSQPYRYMYSRSTEHVSGEYISESKNALQCYSVHQIEDSKYCQQMVGGPVSDCFDLTTFGQGVELIYESTVAGLDSYNIQFSWFCYSNCRNVRYSMYCQTSSNLFGCVGLKGKQYCIFNRQCTQQEYEELVPRIIEQMNAMPYTDKLGRTYGFGQFFPAELSPCEYNSTIAQEHFPLTKEAARAEGYAWYDQPDLTVEIQVLNEDIPDSVQDASPSIVGQVIACAHAGPPAGGCAEQCSSVFTVIAQELAFLIEQELPLPRLCPNCRLYSRLKWRNPIQLHLRQCQCGGGQSTSGTYTNISTEHSRHTANEPCTDTFETSFSPDRPEIVYCEDCYSAEVI